MRAVTFTTDDESLDEFCAEETVTVAASANREPLRTPSVSTPALDQGGAFPWARALAMTPPARQLSVIQDTELGDEPLFPASERSGRDWFAVKPDTASIASFVDSGLGLSFKSTTMELKPDPIKFNRSKAVPISGSLPVSMARPIPSMASVFSKKRDLVSKSWSDLWDEEEEENASHSEGENDYVIPNRGRTQEWKEESNGRDTPRVGLAEMKNPATVNNSRNRTPEAARDQKDDVSEQTGFIFEDDLPALPTTPITPGNQRYSPPSKRSLIDKWAMLGDRRRGTDMPTPVKTPVQSISVPPRKRGRAGSWRAHNIDFNKQHITSHNEQLGVLERHHSDKKEPGMKGSGPWTASKDWRRHASPQQDDDVHEWVFRHDLHL